ncbi:hypothetical protein [Pantoea alhagi]|uniref:hypothetical protein n=1 Tax=Pantoea alhagi TaxID=1891675 RepID=UPI0012F51AD2|nr:hypothetical protein [Pantoea alhagi]
MVSAIRMILSLHEINQTPEKSAYLIDIPLAKASSTENATGGCKIRHQEALPLPGKRAVDHHNSRGAFIIRNNKSYSPCSPETILSRGTPFRSATFLSTCSVPVPVPE